MVAASQARLLNDFCDFSDHRFTNIERCPGVSYEDGNSQLSAIGKADETDTIGSGRKPLRNP